MRGVSRCKKPALRVTSATAVSVFVQRPPVRKRPSGVGPFRTTVAVGEPLTVERVRERPALLSVRRRSDVPVLMPPLGAITRRQDAPAAYDMTTVAYALRPLFVLQHSSIMQGRVRQVVIPRQRAVDIDDEQDFKMAELLLATRQERSLAPL